MKVELTIMKTIEDLLDERYSSRKPRMTQLTSHTNTNINQSAAPIEDIDEMSSYNHILALVEHELELHADIK